MHHYIESATIVALATPPGRGGIGIIRISGQLVPVITPKLLGKIPESRKAEYLSFLLADGFKLEKVIVLFFPKPNSFTGEDVLEIHSHSGAAILDLILARILQISPEIRLAYPGEFSERAFHNGKIDLVQAEAIADIIDATSHKAVRSACNSLQGVFSKRINLILKEIKELRMYIESSIDFSEDNIDYLSQENIRNILVNIINMVRYLHTKAHHGFLLREGLKVVIAGKPNVGKSSLFNLLVGIDRAIVSDVSGTTRDTLHECIELQGIPVYFVDTAGLRDISNDTVERIGMQRARDVLYSADHVFWVIDANDTINQDVQFVLDSVEKELLSINDNNHIIPVTIIRNKSDLIPEAVRIEVVNNYTFITVSVLLNDGIDLLLTHLYNSATHDCIFEKFGDYQYRQPPHYNGTAGGIDNQGNFIARRRHLDSIEKAYQYLLSAQNRLLLLSDVIKDDDVVVVGIDVVAEELKLAHDELGKIVGKFTSDDLLKEIFSTFCIGK